MIQNQLSTEEENLSIPHLLKEELRSVGLKVRYVICLHPSFRQEAINTLKEWDLWGPLTICMLFSLSLALASTDSSLSYDNFINLLLIFWIGSLFSSLNCKMLGKKGSLFQTMSIIGYCSFPLAFFGFIVSILPRAVPIWVNIPIILIALAWSTVACILIMKDMLSDDKKWLCTYPIMLEYIFLAWYALSA